jgi:hypothetical protein
VAGCATVLYEPLPFPLVAGLIWLCSHIQMGNASDYRLSGEVCQLVYHSGLLSGIGRGAKKAKQA